MDMQIVEERSVAAKLEEQAKSKLILVLGRGAAGKSFWTRWWLDRARTEGRAAAAGDADIVARSLSRRMENVLAPDSYQRGDLLKWWEALTSEHNRKSGATIADFSPSGSPLREIAAAFGESFNAYFEAIGVDLVAVHMIGPDGGDVNHFAAARSLIAPRETVLVLNDGIGAVGARAREEIYSGILEDERVKAAVAEGAQLVRMPTLAMHSSDLDEVSSFTEAAAGRGLGKASIGLAHQFMLKKWLGEMDGRFAPVAAALGFG